MATFGYLFTPEQRNEYKKYFILFDRGSKNYLTNDEMKSLLEYIGFKPIVNTCVSCYNKDFKNPVFNVYEGGILCEKCSEHFEHNLKINITTTKLMDYILKNDVLICSKAKVSKYLIHELSRILKIYMNEYLGKINEKSLNLLKSLNKKGVE